jgi:hypothetical protein
MTKVKTTPQNVSEANWGLYNATMNLPQAAMHCGMTNKEMKMTFLEFLKYHPPSYDNTKSVQRSSQLDHPAFILDETQGAF